MALLPAPLTVRAMHDVGDDLGKAKAGSTIKGLLDEIMEPLIAEHEELSSALETIRGILTTSGTRRSDVLKKFDEETTYSLRTFFPGLSLDLDLATVDIKEFFRAADLHVTEESIGDRRRFDQVGSGAQRSIQMAMLRHLANTRARQGSNRRFLLIDEPELYLHPQGVRRLRRALHDLSKSGYQVIFSTHSPLMLSRDNVADTVIIGRSPSTGVTSRKPMREAIQSALTDAESQSRTLFELSNVAEIYFSDLVVICEGKTDLRLLPLAYEQIFGRPPDVDHISFVSVGGCGNIPKTLKVLRTMGISARAVVDLDFGYTHARTGGLLSKSGDDLDAAKACLHKLRDAHGITLNPSGLPQSGGSGGTHASEAWSIFAADPVGRTLAELTHMELKKEDVWAWPVGCIEDVTGTKEKGEDAIAAQEKSVCSMGRDELEKQMPGFIACCEWIRSGLPETVDLTADVTTLSDSQVVR